MNYVYDEPFARIRVLWVRNGRVGLRVFLTGESKLQEYEFSLAIGGSVHFFNRRDGDPEPVAPDGVYVARHDRGLWREIEELLGSE